MTATEGVKPTAIRFPVGLHDEVKAAARERGWSVNALMIRAARGLPGAPATHGRNQIHKTAGKRHRRGKQR